MSTPARVLATLLVALLGTACSDEGGGQDGPHPVPGPDQLEADNDISTNARELTLSGYAHVDLPADFEALDGEARAAALERVVEARLAVVGRAVGGHLEAVLAPLDDGTSGESPHPEAVRPPRSGLPADGAGAADQATSSSGRRACQSTRARSMVRTE